MKFNVSGGLESLGCSELQRLFGDYSDGHRFILDLKDLELVDRIAVRFLAICESRGIRLENCPTYIRSWITREVQPE